MKLKILALATAAVLAAPVAHAQVMIDMTKVSCADYTAMPPDQSRDFSAWMSGWFHQKTNDTTINFDGYLSNAAAVKSWCASNPKELVMAGLDRALPKAKTGVGGPIDIDAAVITCKQFMTSPPDRQAIVHAWMAGYFSASKNLSTIDPRYVARNAKVVTAFCKKRPNDTLMSAIANNAK